MLNIKLAICLILPFLLQQKLIFNTESGGENGTTFYNYDDAANEYPYRKDFLQSSESVIILADSDAYEPNLDYYFSSTLAKKAMSYFMICEKKGQMAIPESLNLNCNHDSITAAFELFDFLNKDIKSFNNRINLYKEDIIKKNGNMADKNIELNSSLLSVDIRNVPQQKPKLNIYSRGNSSVMHFELTKNTNGMYFYKLKQRAEADSKYRNKYNHFSSNPDNNNNKEAGLMMNWEIKDTDIILVVSDGFRNNVFAGFVTYALNYLIIIQYNEYKKNINTSRVDPANILTKLTELYIDFVSKTDKINQVFDGMEKKYLEDINSLPVVRQNMNEDDLRKHNQSLHDSINDYLLFELMDQTIGDPSLIFMEKLRNKKLAPTNFFPAKQEDVNEAINAIEAQNNQVKRKDIGQEPNPNNLDKNLNDILNHSNKFIAMKKGITLIFEVCGLTDFAFEEMVINNNISECVEEANSLLLGFKQEIADFMPNFFNPVIASYSLINMAKQIVSDNRPKLSPTSIHFFRNNINKRQSAREFNGYNDDITVSVGHIISEDKKTLREMATLKREAKVVNTGQFKVDLDFIKETELSVA